VPEGRITPRPEYAAARLHQVAAASRSYEASLISAEMAVEDPASDNRKVLASQKLRDPAHCKEGLLVLRVNQSMDPASDRGTEPAGPVLPFSTGLTQPGRCFEAIFELFHPSTCGSHGPQHDRPPNAGSQQQAARPPAERRRRRGCHEEAAGGARTVVSAIPMGFGPGRRARGLASTLQAPPRIRPASSRSRSGGGQVPAQPEIST